MSTKILTELSQDIENLEHQDMFPFKLDTFQINSCWCIDKGYNVLLTAPTGSGKTVLAEYAIEKAHKLGWKIAYTSPIKALSNQKYYEFKTKHPEWEVGIYTGDQQVNPEAKCVIMTTEILRNILFLNDTESLPQIVIFDEVHYINDDSRGHVWEEVFMLLPPEIHLVMLSATIGHPEDFSNWISKLKNKPTYLVETKHRNVPLEHYVYNEDNTTKVVTATGELIHENYQEWYNFDKKNTNINKNIGQINKKLNKITRFLKHKELLPTTIFTFNRKKCMQYADMIQGVNLIDHEESIQVERLINKFLLQLGGELQKYDQVLWLKKLMMRGIAVHHAGIIPVMKEVIEMVYAKGLIKLLFATETFAVGVNMPTKTVVFTELDKFDGRERRLLKTNEYIQMAGRAGRRGLDVKGHVIIMPLGHTVPSLQEFKEMVIGKLDRLISKFNPNYGIVLKILASGNCIEKVAQNTFYHCQNLVNIPYFEKMIENVTVEIENSTTITPPDCYEEYTHLVSELNGKRSNQARKLQRKIDILKNKNINLQNYLYQQKNYENLEKNKQQHIDSIEYCKNGLTEDIQSPMAFLWELKYIDIDENTNKINLTLKGKIGSMISECNPILITEVIYSNILNDLSMEDIMAILSVLVMIEDGGGDNKNNNSIPCSPSDLLVSKKCLKVLSSIREISQNLGATESNFQVESPANWDMNLDSVNSAYLWSLNKNNSLSEVFKYYKNFEGNFVQDMRRLTQFATKVRDMSELLGLTNIVEKLRDIEKIMLRDIVRVDSLYIYN